MLESDRAEFGVLLCALAATFRTEADEAMLEGYWIALSDLPIEAVQMAVARAIRECEYFPRGRELRALTGELSLSARAVVAWGFASKAMSAPKGGSYRSVNFDDPIINATIRLMGGWIAFGDHSQKDFDKWIRKEFERTYVAIAQRPVGHDEGQPLLGEFDRVNGGGGYGVKPPLQITTGLPPLQIASSRPQESIEKTGLKAPLLIVKRP